LGRVGVDTPDPTALNAVAAYLAHRRWQVAEESPARVELAAVLDATVRLHRTSTPGVAPVISGEQAMLALLDPYARAAEEIARGEVAGLDPNLDRQGRLERIIIGTVLMDRALSALRRLAQEHFFTLAAESAPTEGSSLPPG
jgi:hypothetical protein